MKVEYIDHMGSDLSVVNAARVSFDKESYHPLRILLPCLTGLSLCLSLGTQTPSWSTTLLHMVTGALCSCHCLNEMEGTDLRS